MISDRSVREAFVWIWLPEALEPVVAGKITADGDRLLFNYGKHFLARAEAIPLYDAELPLHAGLMSPPPGLAMPGCIRDASPDAWGRRVIMNRLLRVNAKDTGTVQVDELRYLLESGSDRIGALDFQRSATEYVPRQPDNAPLEQLAKATDYVEQGLPLNPELEQALRHGTSLGGARPKAQIDAGETKYIAKFSSTTDIHPVVKAEFIAMRLAALVGLNVARVLLTNTFGKDVLLIERFDRIHTSGRFQRRAMISALTILGLDEMMARYASYADLAEVIRHRFADARATLKELFSRSVFNILCGNTDDHARNHAAFWDGSQLRLTPAYDICPQNRTGNEATQAMLIAGQDRMSRLSSCLNAAGHFLLSREQAIAIVAHQLEGILTHWDKLCDEAELRPSDRVLLWRRQFLNPFAFDDLDGDAADLKALAQSS
jgi:serine/threonine-protein kinase HipA